MPQIIGGIVVEHNGDDILLIPLPPGRGVSSSSALLHSPSTAAEHTIIRVLEEKDGMIELGFHRAEVLRSELEAARKEKDAVKAKFLGLKSDYYNLRKSNKALQSRLIELESQTFFSRAMQFSVLHWRTITVAIIVAAVSIFCALQRR